MTSIITSIVRSAYDAQKLRISTGNRIVQAYRHSLGVTSGEKPDEEIDAHLEALRQEYRRITDGLMKLPQRGRFKPTEIMTSFTLLTMLDQYESLLAAEERQMGAIKGELEASCPIWNSWLAGVRGCGPTMGGVLLSTLDVRKAARPSQFWAYAGLDVAGDGRGRSRRTDHLVTRKFLNAKGEEAERQGVTFNPWLKTKLFVLATSFLRSASPYRAHYDAMKGRLENAPARELREIYILNSHGWHWAPAENNLDIAQAWEVGESRVRMTTDWQSATPIHRHNAAMRFMLKQFLLDLWREWRTIEGLPIVPPYAPAKFDLKRAA